jgi:hypothetical protein
MPVILLSHHPLVSVDEVFWPYCAVAGCFTPRQFQMILDRIGPYREAGPSEIVSFGGHVHGFAEGLGGLSVVFNANKELAPRKGEGIRVVITEATMVGSNEADKGFIGIVTVDDQGKLSVGKPQGDSLPAFNPHLFVTSPHYNRAVKKWQVGFAIDSLYTTRCGVVHRLSNVLLGGRLCYYQWEFGDGAGTSTRDLRSVTHDYDPGTYTVCVVVTDDPGKPERADRTCTKLTLQPR